MLVMNGSEMPAEWLNQDSGTLAPTGLPVRFSEQADDAVMMIADYYGISRARVVRILVDHSLREIGLI